MCLPIMLITTLLLSLNTDQQHMTTMGYANLIYSNATNTKNVPGLAYNINTLYITFWKVKQMTTVSMFIFITSRNISNYFS
jgi:hypothetical protein